MDDVYEKSYDLLVMSYEWQDDILLCVQREDISSPAR
jgi:hypothetical protein